MWSGRREGGEETAALMEVDEVEVTSPAYDLVDDVKVLQLPEYV